MNGKTGNPMSHDEDRLGRLEALARTAHAARPEDREALRMALDEACREAHGPRYVKGCLGCKAWTGLQGINPRGA